MIRRDYILRMIQEFAEALARIRSLKQGERWNEVADTLDAEFRNLIGGDTAAVAALSETELLARIMRGEPTLVVRHKTLALTTLLKEAGDAAAADHRTAQSRECYLKALHLLLDVLGRGEVFELPEFVPRVEGLVQALADAPLPVRTQVMLMHHYERSGEFARAEDALFAVLDAEADKSQLLEFGMAFYRRLAAQSDAALADGNLSRAEIEQGMDELRARCRGK